KQIVRGAGLFRKPAQTVVRARQRYAAFTHDGEKIASERRAVQVRGGAAGAAGPIRSVRTGGYQTVFAYGDEGSVSEGYAAQPLTERGLLPFPVHTVSAGVNRAIVADGHQCLRRGRHCFQPVTRRAVEQGAGPEIVH